MLCGWFMNWSRVFWLIVCLWCLRLGMLSCVILRLECCVYDVVGSL